MYSREKLKKLREDRGLTQYELAEIAGISVVTLNKIESSDLAKPFAKTLNKIAQALGVGIDELSESERKSSPDVFSEINAAICSRAKVIADLMKIDSFMFGYIQKQLDIFRRDLCQFFGISDSILLEAVLFSGASWSRPGNTTHESHFPEVLGDLLALQGISIPVDRKNIIIDTEDKIEEYAKARCVYGICNREGELLRIGETIDLPRRFHEHISKLKKEEYPSMKKYLKGTAQFRIDYHFKLLALEPEKLSGLQSATWRYYAETKLILEEKTYLKGNSYNGKAIVTGDTLIPEHVQKEMIKYYHNIEL